MDEINKVLEFWFEGINDSTKIVASNMPFKKWFMKDDSLDKEIKDQFEGVVSQIAKNSSDQWDKNPKGNLAKIIVCDQFVRNIYRDTRKMFFLDEISLKVTKESLANNTHKEGELIERVFILMPLMHSENIEDQRMCIEFFEELVADSTAKCPGNSGYYKSNVEYAKKHCEIIQRFNRFPHRNQLLNRESTQEEIDFMKHPGSSF